MNSRAVKFAAGLVVGAALSASAVMLTANDARNGRRAVTRVLLSALASWDSFHARHEPHAPFTRQPKRLDYRPLSEQARTMWEDLEARFLALDGRLLMTTTPPVEIGDLCLWQGVYAATAALESSRRRDAPSRRRAEAAFDGLRMMLSRGRPLARSVLPADIVTEPPGKWYYRSAEWQWKEDASVDSAAGWVFGTLMVVELVPSRRAEALDALRHYADVLIEGGLYLRNSDGKRTRFPSVGGDFVSSPVGVLGTLAVLRTLERSGAGEPYASVHQELVAAAQHEWGAYATAPAFFRNVTTNHNIAILGLISAMLAEDQPARWRVYAHGLLRFDRLTERMGNSYWIYLTDWAFAQRPQLAATLAGERDYEAFKASRAERIRRARTSMLEWDYPRHKRKEKRRNSNRADLEFARWFGLGPREAHSPLPIHERPGTDFVWQRSPYQLDGWLDYDGPPQDFAPLDFLSAYSLGRSIGALSAVD